MPEFFSCTAAVLILRKIWSERALATRLIYASSDGEAFNACLAVREINSDVHIAAYFDDRETAKRAERLARVDAIVSISTEMLVRAARPRGGNCADGAEFGNRKVNYFLSCNWY